MAGEEVGENRNKKVMPKQKNKRGKTKRPKTRIRKNRETDSLRRGSPDGIHVMVTHVGASSSEVFGRARVRQRFGHECVG